MVYQQTDRARAAPGAGQAAGWLCLAALAVVALGRAWSLFPPDLSALWMAGHLWAEGRFALIYAAPPGFFGASPAAWAPVLAEAGLAGQPATPFVYPPLWAAAMAPLAEALSPQAFFRGAAVLLIAMLGASVWLAWRLARFAELSFAVWAGLSAVLLATSVIAYAAFMHLQPQILVVFLVLLSFERYAAGKATLAGALLGLAAAIKLIPLALALVFVLERDRRALAALAGTLAVLGAAGLAVAGPDLHAAFLDSLAAAGEGLLVSSVTYSAHVPAYAAAAWAGLAPGFDTAATNIRLLAVPPWLPLSVRVLGTLLLVWMLLRTAALPRRPRLVARLFLISLLANLFGPLGWSHYYLPHLLLLPALLALLPRRDGTLAILTLGLFTAGPVQLALARTFPGHLAPALIGAILMLTLFVLVTARARS